MPSGPRYGWTVFTNVDPARRLARRSLASPVLALVRVPSDGAGFGLARALDDEVALSL